MAYFYITLQIINGEIEPLFNITPSRSIVHLAPRARGSSCLTPVHYYWWKWTKNLSNPIWSVKIPILCFHSCQLVLVKWVLFLNSLRKPLPSFNFLLKEIIDLVCFFLPWGSGPIPEVLQYRADPRQRWSKPLALRHDPKISLISLIPHGDRIRY